MMQLITSVLKSYDKETLFSLLSLNKEDFHCCNNPKQDLKQTLS